MTETFTDLDALADEVGRRATEKWRELAMDALREAGTRLDWDVQPVLDSFTTVHRAEDGSWTFGVDHQSAGFLEWGTTPHTITPADPDGVLVFEVNGETVFTDEVDHPGTPPVLYMTHGENRLIIRGLSD